MKILYCSLSVGCNLNPTLGICIKKIQIFPLYLSFELTPVIFYPLFICVWWNSLPEFSFNIFHCISYYSQCDIIVLFYFCTYYVTLCWIECCFLYSVMNSCTFMMHVVRLGILICPNEGINCFPLLFFSHYSDFLNWRKSLTFCISLSREIWLTHRNHVTGGTNSSLFSFSDC